MRNLSFKLREARFYFLVVNTVDSPLYKITTMPWSGGHYNNFTIHTYMQVSTRIPLSCNNPFFTKFLPLFSIYYSCILLEIINMDMI